MFQLIADVGPNSEPVAPIRWCISPDILAELRRRHAMNPHILLSVWHEGKEFDRKCVPLEQAMEYVEFRRAGLNHIRACIVFGPDPKRFRHVMISRVGLEPMPFDFDGNLCSWVFEHRLTEIGTLPTTTAAISINVGSEFFAHEPPAWEKMWVNLWFERSPRDQCEYRRRRFVAYTIQPVAVLLWTIFITIIKLDIFLACLVLGRIYGLSFEPVLHPFRNNLDDVWPRQKNGDGCKRSFDDQEENFFFYTSGGSSRPFGFALLYPMWWIIAAGILFLASVVDLKPALYILGTVCLAGALSLAGIPLLLYWEYRVSKNPPKSKVTESFKKHDQMFQKRMSAYEATFSDVVCGGLNPMRADLKDLQHPTFALRFKAFKAKVCQPYLR